MHVSLGRCHYGGDDVATMTGVRPGRTGWIAVCAGHAADAERDGFRLREHADVLLEPSGDEPARVLREPYGDEPARVPREPYGDEPASWVGLDELFQLDDS